MLKSTFSLLLVLVLSLPFSVSAKSIINESAFLKKNENVNKEIINLSKKNKNAKSLLEDIFRKSLNIYLKQRSSHDKHYINYLFKSKLEEINFNQEQILSLKKIKSENLKKARKKIKISKKVLEKMNIQTLEYYQSKEKIASHLLEIKEENSLIEIKCPLKTEKFYKCYKTDKGEISELLFSKLKPGSDSYQLDKDIEVNMNLLSLRSGSGAEERDSELLRMSFFLNGVILDTGDF